MPLITERWADRTHFIALGLVAIGLPLSKILLSIGGILLALEWLIGGDLRERSEKAFRDPVVLCFLAFYGIHLVGLFYSSDMEEASKELRVKLPLLLFPLAIGGRGEQATLRPLFFTFIAAFFLSSILSYLEWKGWIELPWESGEDPTLFISAIRLSLMGCLTLFFSGFLIKEERTPLLRILLLLSIAWTLFFMSILATAISMVVIGALLLFLILRWWRRSRRTWLLFLLGGIIFLPTAYLTWEVRDHYRVAESPVNDTTQLPERTPRGAPYDHHPEDGALENNHYVWLYVSEPELQKAWNARSELPFSGKDRKGNLLKATLIRYMSSKGLKKDAAGMEKMSEADIRRVENGVANLARHRMNPLRKRIRKVIFEIDRYMLGRDPSGNSVTQRFEFWRAGSYLIKENPIWGVGTGDVKNAFERAYKKIGTDLDPEYRRLAHQQFMSCWIAWGIPGFILLLLLLFLPPARKGAFHDPFYCIFFITLFLSFFTEDTLGTQVGVTLFTFWNCVLLFGRRSKGPPPVQDERPS